MSSSKRQAASLVGAIAAAAAASACCVGPLIFAVLGIGGAGALVALDPYRPLFTALTVGLLGVGWYLTYRPARARVSAQVSDDCDCAHPKTSQFGKKLLWLATLLASTALLSPYLPAATAAQAPTPAQAAASHTDRFIIEGMTCSSCAVTIHAAAQKLDGLIHIDVDADAGSATVIYDSAKLTAAQIAAQLSSTGYPTSVAAQ